jgi:cell division septation protein DedD
VCLSCGERLALEQKEAGGRPVLFAVSALAAVALICLVLVAQALIGGGGESRREPVARRTATPAVPSGPDAAQRAAQRKARRQVVTALPGWPADQAGWTVVLLGASDKASAENLARGLKGAGVDAGLISPEERPDTGTLWLVYSGVYPDQATASAQATKLRLRYPGVYARYVPTAPSSGAPAQTPPG